MYVLHTYQQNITSKPILSHVMDDAPSQKSSSLAEPVQCKAQQDSMTTGLSHNCITRSEIVSILETLHREQFYT